jgi:transaldolase
MKFFVDTADTAEIKSPAASGPPGGITANPSFMVNTGENFTDIISEIRAIGLARTGAGVADYLANRGKKGQTIG